MYNVFPNPMLSANFLSKMLFCWLDPLLRLGRQRPLELADIHCVLPDDGSYRLGAVLEKEWQKEVKEKEDSGGRTKPSLGRVLIRVFGFRYLMLGFLLLIEEAVRVPQPVFLWGLISYFTAHSQVTQTEAYLYALGVSLSAVVAAQLHNYYSFEVARMGMKIRVSCCSVMYRTIMRMSSTAMEQTTTGQIVNLMSNDVTRAEESVAFLNYLWVAPLQMIALLIVIWYILGPFVLPAFAVFLLLIPMQAYTGKIFSKLRWNAAVLTDERVKLMNEVIDGMRVIKMYCWEGPFVKHIQQIRREELRYIQKTCYLTGLNFVPFVFMPKLMILIILTVFVLMGITITSVDLFVPLAVVNGLRGLLIFLPEALRYIGELSSSLQRLDNFLSLDQADSAQLPVAQNEHRPKPEDCSVTISNLTAKWHSKMEQNTLDQISASVKAGQLMAIVGPVGSGKSSLLLAILRELRPSSGSVSVRGKVAYVSQKTWVFSGSLRQNVIFGSPYNKRRFDKVMQASAMQRDLDIMPYGEKTLIGERGVCLSGGQRARLSLARALYSDADIFLLDDPLSAVDTAVSRHIFYKCILGVLRYKVRILVTHQLQYLRDADCILILKEGRVECMGTYKEVASSGGEFAQMLKLKENNPVVRSAPSDSSLGPPMQAAHYQVSLLSLSVSCPDFEPEPVQLQEEEAQKKGTVHWKVYVEYFTAGAGIASLLLLAVVTIMAQAASIMSDWWLSKWSNAEEDRLATIRKNEMILSQGSNQTTVNVPKVGGYYIHIYVGIISVVLFLGIAYILHFCKVAVDAAQRLHDNMLATVMHSPVRFFDSNPVGRTLNRFTKDMGQIDENLPVTFLEIMRSCLPLAGVVIVAGVVNPYVFIPIIPIVASFIYTSAYCLPASRSVKRLEGICRSPVYSYLSSSLQGLPTIRAFGMTQKCQEEFDDTHDLHTAAWFIFLCVTRWQAVRLDWLCFLFVAAVTFGAVLSAGTLNAGMVALSVTYALTLVGMFQWGVRQIAYLENQMISVERVLEYCNLPPESSLESVGGHRPPDDWPDSGVIQANGVCLRYSPEGPLILKHLTFSIKSKEKVGIVGRTGAGKSSIITCMYRLAESTGHMSIDDVHIFDLRLRDLRKVISIVPQDPVLFVGTLRRNLDPFQHHSDEQLWKVLEDAQLKSAVKALPLGLDTEVSEGGNNFSVGQRQLVCLARAILCQNRILLVDEATANVDPKTDQLIQSTIREKFCECTVLTIAHRLDTIIDSDRIMVLSEGRIVDFEAPHLLLQRGSGVFYDMVQNTGKAMAELLARKAEDAFTRRPRGDSRDMLTEENTVMEIWLVPSEKDEMDPR